MKDKERDLENKPKYKDALLAYSNATLGISMVVAVLIGVGAVSYTHLRAHETD